MFSHFKLKWLLCAYSFAAKDASFAGQGVCYETMQLAHVKEFDVGGTIHVIINNQATGWDASSATQSISFRHLPYQRKCWLLMLLVSCLIAFCLWVD